LKLSAAARAGTGASPVEDEQAGQDFDVTANPRPSKNSANSAAKGPQTMSAQAQLGPGNLHGYGMHISGQML